MVLVRPGRIGLIRAKNGSPTLARSVLLSHSVAAFTQLLHSLTQLHENGFEPVNNSFRGETSVGGVYAVEYQ